MVNANELRLGNWICRPDGKQVQVTNVSSKGMNIGLDIYGIEVLFEYAMPIRLTKEILKNLGFTYWTQDDVCTDPNDAYWTKGSFAISNNSGMIHDIGSNKVKVKYLHQLQNAYYFLTGEELNYTL